MYINLLQLTRQFIIAWVTVSLMPTEVWFDGIEAELERHGVNPNT